MIELPWAERVEVFDDEGLTPEMRAERDRYYYRDMNHLRRLRDRRKRKRPTRDRRGARKLLAMAPRSAPKKPHRARWRAIRRMAEQHYHRNPQPLRGYFTMPKSAWGDGPWQQEPDRIVWTSEQKYRCVMRRSPMGNWNGYVAVPKGHPAHGLPYDDVDVTAHGGLTYGQPNREFHTPCRARRAWWFGFDCAHAFDVMPAMEALSRSLPGMTGIRAELTKALGDSRWGGVYRNVAEVHAETEELAEQLAKLAEPKEQANTEDAP